MCLLSANVSLHSLNLDKVKEMGRNWSAFRFTCVSLIFIKVFDYPIEIDAQSADGSGPNFAT